jgi:hypothetical protein
MNAGDLPVGHLLDTQARAALLAAPIDDGSALAGAHAKPKAVGSLPTTIVRLECSFHCFYPCFWSTALASEENRAAAA